MGDCCVRLSECVRPSVLTAVYAIFPWEKCGTAESTGSVDERKLKAQTRDFRRRQESRERTGIYWVNVYFTVNKCPVHRKVQCLGPPSPGFPSVCHTDRTQVLPIDKISEFMHLSATSFYKLLHRSVVEAVVLDLTKALNFINQAWELKAQCPASFRGDTDPTQLTEIAK